MDVAFALILLQEDLRNKLEQLSDMYEEVSTRLESLEEAYDNAEVEVRAINVSFLIPAVVVTAFCRDGREGI